MVCLLAWKKKKKKKKRLGMRHLPEVASCQPASCIVDGIKLLKNVAGNHNLAQTEPKSNTGRRGTVGRQI